MNKKFLVGLIISTIGLYLSLVSFTYGMDHNFLFSMIGITLGVYSGSMSIMCLNNLEFASQDGGEE